MAIPGLPEAATSQPPQVAGAVRQPVSAFGLAQGRVADGLIGGAERAVNQFIGVDVRGDFLSKQRPIAGAPDSFSAAPKSRRATGNQTEASGPTAAGTEAAHWGDLSAYLMARILPCNSKGEIIAGELPVLGPATDVQFSASFNWQSPFENAGPESKAPTLMAMLQTGQVAVVANALQAVLPGGPAADLISQGADIAKRLAADLEGKTGITKLNSRQVFAGMPPIKISLTLHLRAMTDPAAEVMAPYKRLLEWAMPRKLASDGILDQIIRNTGDTAADLANMVKALFPSDAPTMVWLVYGNNRYAPMVIESVENQLDGPMDSSGLPIYRAVNLQLATLTALDKTDVATLFSR